MVSKKFLFTMFAVIMLSSLYAGDKAMLSTTMDFLDIVFYSPISRELGYYPLEHYEKAIKNLADAGFKKVYIRNCIGLTFYNTKVRAKYSRENIAHFAAMPDEAAWLENTINKYDPLAETIRLCHKYGMEAWAHDNYHEEVGSLCTATSNPEAPTGFYPLCDPFYIKHPEYLAMIRPSKKHPSPEQAEKINRSVSGKRVGKIVAVSDIPSEYPLRINKNNLHIYYSNDNVNWTRYEKEFLFESSRSTDKYNSLTISNLDIAAKYVKLTPTETFPYDGKYSYIINNYSKGCKVYDTEGKRLIVQWGSTWGQQKHKNAVTDALFLDYSIGNHAWDANSLGLGFGVGLPRPYGESYRRGWAELHIPAVMEHRLKAFAELAAYDFDGFCFSSRTHSVYFDRNPDLFGFNREVREKFMERYGEDIWSSQFKDLKKLQAFRAEALDEYLAQCKKIAGKRPIYAAVPATSPSVRKNRPNGVWWNSFGSMPYNYEKWVENGSVDGLIMHGWCNPAEFKALKEKYGIKISLFHKVETHIKFPPAEREAHLKDILSLDGLDEVELYESCLISDHPQHLKIIRSAVDHKDPVPGGNAATLKRVQEKVNNAKW